MNRIVISLGFIAAFLGLRSQDFQAFQTSNYAGVLGVYSNPASIADNRLTFDLNVFALNFVADNNYVGVKRSALKRGKDADGKTVFTEWSNTDKNSPGYYKNNFIT